MTIHPRRGKGKQGDHNQWAVKQHPRPEVVPGFGASPAGAPGTIAEAKHVDGEPNDETDAGDEGQ